MHLTHITINSIDHERRIINQAYTAVSANYRVSIIAFGRKGESKSESRPYAHLKRIISPFINGGPLKFIHFNLKMFVLLWQEPPDIVHAHDLWVLPGAAMAAHLKNKKLIYDAHVYYAGLEIFNRHPVRKMLWLMLERKLVQYADVLLTVSDPLAEKYRVRYPGIPDCRVIRNLPVREIPDRTRAKPFPRPFEHMLVYHGHLKPGRGLTNLIRAMGYLDDTGLVIFGGGELFAELRQLVEKLDLSSKVIFRSYIDLESLISTSAQADIGITLFERTSINYSYALPNKFFEYIMAGLPVLASDIETFTFYMNTYDIGKTVDPADPGQIADAIREMTTDHIILDRWRKNARKAAETLNWDHESAEMINIYEKLAD